MYKQIKKQKTTRELYAEQLVAEKVITAEEAQQTVDEFNEYLEKSFAESKTYQQGKADYLEGAWSDMKVASVENDRGHTAVDLDKLQLIGSALTTLPDDFKANSKIIRQLKAKAKMFETGEGFDWSTAEAMAFASLVDQKFPVRLSGQDCGRGTFSQRHAILYDQDTEKKYLPIQNVAPDQAHFEVHDSPLSELAVMGFEYGYALADPKTLVMWEGQFGDFVNGAQVMIDQFISSGETKWLRMCGLVLLLPHGMEGQGPEHSSARLERFLQNSAEDNWQVANCTTPANYFHILRRQLCRDFRKPLILMTPKSLLRHKLCVSKLEEFAEGSSFHRILWDDDLEDLNEGKDIKRVVMCSGKVYFDLLQERRERKLKDVMILRLEQLYPFPSGALAQELEQYPNADIIWCQEEAKNMGAWSFVEPEIETVLTDIKHKVGRASYVGRIAAASPASGSLKRHNEEQTKLVDEALSL